MLPLVVILLILVFGLSEAKDWPTYRCDNRRSGVTSEHLSTPLYEQWRYIPRHAPRPAWTPPAEADYWHNLVGLRPRATYDRTFHVTATGDLLCFASSADDKVYCLDAETGMERWVFFTGGPVRLAPTIWRGRVYFGSDDGYAYCLDARDGKLIWRFKAYEEERLIPGNGRVISLWPVRTGVLVEDGIAYFAAGLFPKEGVYLCALNALDGSRMWVKRVSAASPQGYLLASVNRLYVPNGRIYPSVFDRRSGEFLKMLPCPRAEGGTYALLTDDLIISGPGSTAKFAAFDPGSYDRIATFDGRCMIVTRRISYLLSDTELLALDRVRHHELREKGKKLRMRRDEISKLLKGMSESSEERRKLEDELNEVTEEIRRVEEAIQECYVWGHPCRSPYHSLILAGDLLFAGGKDEVVALSASDGRQIWKGKVKGNAYGLAVCEGRLYVSTDKGTIHCFGERIVSDVKLIRPSDDPSPYPSDELTELIAKTAKRIVDETGIRKGYCLMLGCVDGRLAYELVKMTDLKVIVVEEDGEKACRVREVLDKAGLYGVRVVVHEGRLSRLPYTDYIANLIISERTLLSGELPGDADEVLRVLRPFGGTVYLGQPADLIEGGTGLDRSKIEDWLKGVTVPEAEIEISEENGIWLMIRRGALPGSGEWTHLYADAGNTACSKDRLVRSPTRIQWFGQPGPRPMVDRHHRSMAPLFKDGRLFAIGSDRVIAVDAYNGTILWDLEVPGSRRVGMLRDCGNAALADDYLYIAARDECWGLEVETGRRALIIKVPQLIQGERRFWGYVAVVDDLLFGSGERETAARTVLDITTVYETYFDNRPVVTSDYIFCLDRHTGDEIWHYRGGVIVNSAIAIGDGRLYLIESRNPEARRGRGRVRLDVLLKKGVGYLAAFDIHTGEKVWERQTNFPFQHVVHLCYANGVLLVVGTDNQNGHPCYHLYGFDAGDGILKWRRDYLTNYGVNGDHGEQDQHPVIVGDTIYSYCPPFDYDLQTGERGSFHLARGGHGCGTLSGSAFCLFGRGGYPRMYEISKGGESNIALDFINRPGCWINIIPAGGLILIPEGSSGCTCSYPMKTSLALLPGFAQ
jgi:outer membrane protein assembly factor BamB